MSKQLEFVNNDFVLGHLLDEHTSVTISLVKPNDFSQGHFCSRALVLFIAVGPWLAFCAGIKFQTMPLFFGFSKHPSNIQIST